MQALFTLNTDTRKGRKINLIKASLFLIRLMGKRRVGELSSSGGRPCSWSNQTDSSGNYHGSARPHRDAPGPVLAFLPKSGCSSSYLVKCNLNGRASAKAATLHLPKLNTRPSFPLWDEGVTFWECFQFTKIVKIQEQSYWALKKIFFHPRFLFAHCALFLIKSNVKHSLLILVFLINNLAGDYFVDGKGDNCKLLWLTRIKSSCFHNW